MEYEKLNKALRCCAGPDCCKDACPYYGETRGGKTCRAWLLTDAEIAIAAKKTENEVLAEEVNRIAAERDKLAKECEELTAYAHALEKDGESVRRERDKVVEECKTLNADVDDLESVNNTIRAERDELRISVERLAEKCVVMEEGKKTLLQHIEVQKGEIAALRAERNRLETLCQGKTDRPSVGIESTTAYWCGRADALAEVVGSIIGEASGNE